MQATRSTWLNLQQESEPAPQLERATTSLSPLVTQILHNRGISADDLPAFLSPYRSYGYDPMLLRGMGAAVHRLLEARQRGELLAIYGDFDVDGITSTALLVQACTMAGLRAVPYIPHRQSEGSGLHRGALEGLAAQGVRLVVTADCGITSASEVGDVEGVGMDVIVTDHHSPPNVLPPALAIVDPLQPGCSYPNKDLSGVGVAYKLAQALLRAVDVPADRERSLLDLVAIGTIADMVPLLGENRVLVWHGMRVLNDTQRLGLQAIITRSGLRPGTISSTDVGYKLCPRLNAAGRLDHASLGYDLIMAESYGTADLLAQRLEEKNAERQVLTQQALAAVREALALQPRADCCRMLVVHIEPWASGVMGLLAGKLVEEFGKPVVVLHTTGNEVRGSVRGTRAFGMLEALRANADLLDRYGGHELAAGFSTRPELVPLLTERLRARAANALVDADVLPTLRIDAVMPARQLTWQLYDQLQAIEPCGVGNPLPLFLCRRLRLFEYRRVGNNHLRLTVGRGSQRLSAIVFRRGDLAQYLRRNMEIDLVFSLEANDWNGYRSLQMRVRDMSFEPAHQSSLEEESSAPV